jgi:hypothetical protein
MSPRELNDLRPISVTPILARLFERMIIRSFILPKLPKDLLENKYAFKPTGSTFAAMVSTYHHVISMLEDNSYVHCLCIDFSKAFDTVNHKSLLEKLASLPIISKKT